MQIGGEQVKQPSSYQQSVENRSSMHLPGKESPFGDLYQALAKMKGAPFSGFAYFGFLGYKY